MPVLLDQEGTNAWLSGKAGVELLKAVPEGALRMWPVSCEAGRGVEMIRA
jgi:putative SOS response-associated peptidase YedK